MQTENKLTVSVVLPCRNEEEALGECLKQIKQVFADNNINGEIIVSDSSTDRSPEIAREFGVILIKHDQIGYGRAYLEGFKIVKGEYIFMADPDGSYDFYEIPKFIKYLTNGNDFILGNRFGGQMEKGAMPWLHRHIGSPFFSLLFKILFKTKIADVHCGMRAIKKETLNKLYLKSEGMEFASEMIIKTIKNNLKIKQLNINYTRRKGEPKLRPFIDGMRHIILIIKLVK